MKQNKKWNILFTASDSHSKVRPFSISGHFMVAMLIFCVAGMVGFGRLVYLGTSLGIARLGLYEERQENHGLLLKMKFLEKFIQKEADKIENVVRYEDRARLKYGLNLISEDVRKAGVGGKPTTEDLLASSMMDPVVTRSLVLKDNISDLLRQAELQESTFIQMSDNVRRMHNRWAHRPSIWPAFGRLTSTFGYRVHPVAGYRLFHSGIDIANKTWTPVFSTADGIVKSSGTRSHFGITIEISHHNGEFETLYAHLQRAAVTSGQVVKRGDLIGYLGSTGLSTGPHLHYEVRKNGSSVNPLAFILSSEIIVD